MRHPRVCGEQALGSSPRVRGTAEAPLLYSSLQAVGSSPRVRGTARLSGPLEDALGRFIPACAGNRTPTCRFHDPGSVRISVHPRVCGEQDGEWILNPSDTSLAVHPRVCGEQTSLYVLDITHFPRGWKSYRYNARRNSPPWSGHPLSGLSGIGVKLTSFSPSKSRGIRRFVPTVSKSNP